MTTILKFSGVTYICNTDRMINMTDVLNKLDGVHAEWIDNESFTQRLQLTLTDVTIEDAISLGMLIEALSH